MSVFDASVLLLIMNLVISLRIHMAITSWIHSYFHNVITVFDVPVPETNAILSRCSGTSRWAPSVNTALVALYFLT